MLDYLTQGWSNRDSRASCSSFPDCMQLFVQNVVVARTARIGDLEYLEFGCGNFG